MYCMFHIVSSNSVDWFVRSLQDLQMYDYGYLYYLRDRREQTSYRSPKQTQIIHGQ